MLATSASTRIRTGHPAGPDFGWIESICTASGRSSSHCRRKSAVRGCSTSARTWFQSQAARLPTPHVPTSGSSCVGVRCVVTASSWSILSQVHGCTCCRSASSCAKLQHTRSVRIRAGTTAQQRSMSLSRPLVLLAGTKATAKWWAAGCLLIKSSLSRVAIVRMSGQSTQQQWAVMLLPTATSAEPAAPTQSWNSSIGLGRSSTFKTAVNASVSAQI